MSANLMIFAISKYSHYICTYQKLSDQQFMYGGKLSSTVTSVEMKLQATVSLGSTIKQAK